jgi:hypothetical protein
VDPSIIEQQRRIHELESRAEGESRSEEVREHTTHAAVPVPAPVHEVQAYEPPPPPAPKVEEYRAEAPRHREEIREPRVEEPRVDPKQLLNDSGLVMVETDRAKVRVQPQVIEEAPQPVGRPRRERPKPTPQDEQLEQVETRNK